MISVIIPVYNEENTIASLVTYLKQHGGSLLQEIIVCDAASTDSTKKEATKAGATVVVSPEKGRGAQLNYGASKASGSVFYFVHADVFPPQSFASDIQSAVREGYGLGRYRTTFNTKKWYVKMMSIFSRFDWFACYGGDQTLFVTKELFHATGGYRNDMRVMEDYEFVVRARKQSRYKIFSKGALISDRKYDKNSWWKVQKANSTMMRMYKKGASQDEMIQLYKRMLNW
ncbi:MAG: TIGR04283 family arsenosugar biosynthesis glycosyltransferase [Chitinophagaceae bacterium]|jgi:rSAM/selenodomain-associated transferase 2|nr:TIGR04283 family arsenosugar biosynthesis glycosyltransferase [Chitinophagaceae bacterium]